MTTLYPELMEKIAGRRLGYTPGTARVPSLSQQVAPVDPNVKLKERLRKVVTSDTSDDTALAKAIQAYVDPAAKLEDARIKRLTKNENRLQDLEFAQRLMKDKAAKV